MSSHWWLSIQIREGVEENILGLLSGCVPEWEFTDAANCTNQTLSCIYWL